MGVLRSASSLGSDLIQSMNEYSSENFLEEVVLSEEEIRACWEKWKTEGPLKLPSLPCQEVKDIQPVLSQVVKFLANSCGGGQYRVFSNTGLERGLYRPDVSITLVDEAYLFFRFLVSSLEAKVDLESSALKQEAVAQLNSYTSNAALSQRERDVFYGAVTDLRTIHFFKFDRTQSHYFKITPYHPLNLIPENYAKAREPTPGFVALMRLFTAAPKQLGYPEPPPRLRSFGQNDIGEHLGSGGSSTVYSTKEGVIKISTGGDEANRCLRNEIKVLQELNNRPGGDLAQVPTLKRWGEDGGKVWMTTHPQGTPLTAFVDSPKTDDVKYYFEIARSLVFTLQSAHRQGWLHLDVRPSNVVTTATTESSGFVDWKKQVYLIDWGLARKQGSLVTNIMGVERYQSTEWLQNIYNNGVHTLSCRDDLESVAYLVLDLLHTLPSPQTSHDFLKEREAAADKQPQIKDYLEVLRKMTANDLDYLKLANIVRGGRAAADDPATPPPQPKTCQYFMSKEGRFCTLGIWVHSTKYCHIHQRQFSNPKQIRRRKK
jgi:hypothetical protein